MINSPVSIKTYIYSPIKKIKVYYPVVLDIAPHIQQHINQFIIQTLEKLLVENSLNDAGLRHLNGWFEVKTNERGILSIALFVSSYTGGAHDNTHIQALTFDVTSGNIISLKELFKPNSDYTKKNSAIVSKQIAERKMTVLEKFQGIKPDQSFYIADKSLVIYYQLYDLTPYAYGFPFFPISLYEIQDIINEKGILGRLIKEYHDI